MDFGDASIMQYKPFVYLAVIETLSAVPLAYFLPFSNIALVLTFVLFIALNASIIATITRMAWLACLHLLNITICIVSLGLAFGLHTYIWWLYVLIIGALDFCLGAFCVFLLSSLSLKRCFVVQQLVLTSTLILWIVIQHSRLVLSGQDMPLDHFRKGIFFLFLGPLAFSAIAFLSELFGWRSYFILLAVGCIGQWAVGFFELGNALQAYPLIIAGFVLSGGFLLLLILALIPWRRSASAP